jgi:carboxyl-terminal processing protease
VQRFLSKLILASALGCASEPGSIGAVLAQARRDGRLTVREAPSGHAAAEAGVAPGDEILLIEGRDVRSMSPEVVHRLLEGEVGTTVHLTLLRHGKIERVGVRRAPLSRSPLR